MTFTIKSVGHYRKYHEAGYVQTKQTLGCSVTTGAIPADKAQGFQAYENYTY